MSTQIPDLSEFHETVLSESTLLYVEDDKEQQNETYTVFKDIFKNVIVASDGLEALDLYNQNRNEIDIILTDIQMPNMDGISFIENIRQTDWSLPILITTEMDNLEIIPKVIKLKVSNYLFKPFFFKTTLKILLEILEQLSHLSLLEKHQQELEQLRDIIDRQSLVSESDLSGKITYANEIFCNVSGYTQEELIGKPHNIIRHPDVPSNFFEKLWDTIQSGETWTGKVKNRAKDGTSYVVEATIFPIFDTDGEIVKYISSRFLVASEGTLKENLKPSVAHLRTDNKLDKNEINKEVDKALMSSSKIIKDLETEILNLKTLKKESDSKMGKLELITKVAYEKFETGQKKIKECKLKIATLEKQINNS